MTEKTRKKTASRPRGASSSGRKARRTERTEAGGPTLARPRMPSGYGVPKTAAGMMPWEETRKLLERAQSYWLVTLDPDGRPHLVGQWGAWIDDHWYFEGSPETRWARNVARDPRISMGIESGTHAVMVEGNVSRPDRVDRSVSERIVKQYGAKYGRIYSYRPKAEQWDRGGYVLAPTKILAWDVRGFPRTSTRYRFT